MTFLFSLVYLWVKVAYSTIIVKRCWYPMALWVFRVAVLGQLLADRFEPKFKWHQALHNSLPSYKSTAPPVPAQECHRPPQSHARLGWTAGGHDQPKIAGSMNGYKFTTRKYSVSCGHVHPFVGDVAGVGPLKWKKKLFVGSNRSLFGWVEVPFLFASFTLYPIMSG